jgi:hypothetical protein
MARKVIVPARSYAAPTASRRVLIAAAGLSGLRRYARDEDCAADQGMVELRGVEPRCSIGDLGNCRDHATGER